jgi:DNA-binding Xre family transcriptional regulator
MSKTKRRSDYTPLAAQLRAMIAGSDMTLNALALAVEMPEPVLHRFASGARENIRLDTADKLCRFFGVRLTAPKRPTPRLSSPFSCDAGGRGTGLRPAVVRGRGLAVRPRKFPKSTR